MKIQNFKFLIVFLVSLTLVAGCKDDNENQSSAFVGEYVIKNSTTTEAITVETNEMGSLQIPIGTDITVAMQNALLGQVECSSASKTWVELRSDNKIVMSCEGGNELDAGTWQEVSETEIKLNMNSSAIPSSPTGFTLTVADISIAGVLMTGKTSVPLPKEMIAQMIAPLTLSESSPVIFLVKFSIQFEKQ